MQTSSNRNINTDSAIDREFEKIKQWMTCEEIENYLHKDDKPGVLLSMILDRYRKNGELIEQLKTGVNEELAEKLSHIHESMQVDHFFYQAALVDLHKTHSRYMKKINRLLNNIYNNDKR